jgi:hypothetical protein
MYANGHVLTIQNDVMYSLARLTASYREQNTSPKDMMTLITGYIANHLVPFSALRTTQPKFHAECLSWQKDIQENPLNGEGMVTEQAKLRHGL